MANYTGYVDNTYTRTVHYLNTNSAICKQSLDECFMKARLVSLFFSEFRQAIHVAVEKISPAFVDFQCVREG